MYFLLINGFTDKYEVQIYTTATMRTEAVIMIRRPLM